MEKSKKIDFLRFFTCGSAKNESVEYSTGLEYVIEYSGGSKHLRTLLEKMFHLSNPHHYVEYLYLLTTETAGLHLQFLTENSYFDPISAEFDEILS